jgi:predicted RNase H-like HicB family nuclease
MAVYEYTINLIAAEDGGYTVTVPALPGCISEGDTVEDAKANIKEAIRGYIKALKKDGLPVPDEKLEIIKITL